MKALMRLKPWNYFAGNNPASAIQYSKIIKHKPIYNYFVEARPEITPLKMYNKYNQLISDYESVLHNGNIKEHMTNPRVAIKCSSFGFHKEYIDITVKSFLYKGWQVIIDAENDANYSKYKTITHALISNYNQYEPQVIKTYQMYRHDSMRELENDIEQFKNHHLGVKLVRGAYWKSDNKTGKLYTDKMYTDVNFNMGLKYVFDNNQSGLNIIATHNKNSIEKLNELTFKNKHYSHMEYAYLLGLKEECDVNEQVWPVEKNVYIPYGEWRYMLPYMVRRYYEVMM